jgi:hypothetical protein
MGGPPPAGQRLTPHPAEPHELQRHERSSAAPPWSEGNAGTGSVGRGSVGEQRGDPSPSASGLERPDRRRQLGQ